jgi:hypothetical protein
VLGKDEAVDRERQLYLLTVDVSAFWRQQDCLVLDLDLDGSETSFRLTDILLVDGHFVRRLFLAVLHQRVGSSTRIAEGLIVKRVIVLTSP